MNIKQERFVTNPAEDNTQPPSNLGYVWNVPLAISYKGSDGLTHKNSWMTEKNHQIEISEDSNFIVVNSQYNSFLRVLYTGEILEDLSNALNEDIENVHHLSRANFVSDMFAFAENTPLTQVILMLIITSKNFHFRLLLKTPLIERDLLQMILIFQFGK